MFTVRKAPRQILGWIICKINLIAVVVLSPLTHKVTIFRNKRSFPPIQKRDYSTKSVYNNHLSQKDLASDNNISTQVSTLNNIINKMSPWFLTGFIDAEGCFNLSV